MSTIHTTYIIPKESNLEKYVKRYDYCDSFSMPFQSKVSLEEITQKFFRLDPWVRFLIQVRNKLVILIGLKVSKSQKANKRKLPFNVLENNDIELIMGESDKHLDFWLSVKRDNDKLWVTTVVKFNNLSGRIYFLPVKPLHKLIVKHQLKRVL